MDREQLDFPSARRSILRYSSFRLRNVLVLENPSSLINFSPTVLRANRKQLYSTSQGHANDLHFPCRA